MKHTRFLVSFVLAVASMAGGAFGAVGDVTQCIIDKSAFVAFLKISGVSPGGTYVPTNATFTVTSMGFDNTGAATTKTRTLTGGHQMLCPTGDGSIAMSKVQIGPVTGGIFVDGDTVTQAGGATAVVDSNSPCSPLLLRNITGTPNLGAWTDSTTGATATPTTTPTVYTGSPVREGVDGFDLWIAISLSDPVYQKDNTGGGNSGTAPTVTTTAGLYNDGTHNSNAVTALTCTNDSTLAYPKALAHWAVVGGQRFNAPIDIEVIGVQKFAGNQEPLACVIISGADAHSHTTTATLTSMVLSAADNVPVYKTVADPTSFTQLDRVNYNFKAYPNIGDSSCVVDTSGGAAWPQFNATGNPALGPITFTDNQANAQIYPVAVVDSTSNITGTLGGTGTFADHEHLTQPNTGATAWVIGAQSSSPIKVSNIIGSPDGTVWNGTSASITPTGPPTANAAGGTVYKDASLVPGSPGTYASLSVAAANLAAYNNTNNGHNDPGNGTIWMTEQAYHTGDTTSAFVCSDWLTITRKPGLATGKAVIIGYLSLDQLGPTLDRYYDLDFAPVDDYCVSDNWGVWFDHDRFDGTAHANAQPSFQAAHLVTTNCTFSNGFRLCAYVFSTGNWPYITRNNTSDRGAVMAGLVCAGNTLVQGSGETGSTAAIVQDTAIYINNTYRIYGVFVQTAPTLPTGIAFINNLVEKVGTDTQTATAMWADGVTVDAEQVIWWYNTVVGERSNTGYNDKTPASLRTNWSYIGNSCDWIPTKHDIFNQGTGGEGPNPTRIKGWPVNYGVGFHHNHSVQADGGTFAPIYFGVDGTRQSSAGYTLNASESGTNAGGGNYTPAVGSTLIGRIPFAEQPIAFDRAGNTRSTSSTAVGAFAAQSELIATAFEISGGATATPGVSYLGSVTPNGPLPSGETVVVTDDLGNTIATLTFANGSSTGQNFNWTPTNAQSGSRTLTATATPALGSPPTMSVGVAAVAPTLSAGGSVGTISLSWGAITGAATYNVYRGTTPGGESGTPVATGITGTTYNDTGLSPSATFYYTVKSVNTGGTSSSSNEVIATTVARKLSAIPGAVKTNGTNIVVTLVDNYATTFTTGTPGSPTVTVTGATKVGQQVTANNQIKVTINTGGVGTVTFDPGTGFTATVLISNSGLRDRRTDPFGNIRHRPF